MYSTTVAVSGETAGINNALAPWKAIESVAATLSSVSDLAANVAAKAHGEDCDCRICLAGSAGRCFGVINQEYSGISSAMPANCCARGMCLEAPMHCSLCTLHALKPPTWRYEGMRRGQATSSGRRTMQ